MKNDSGLVADYRPCPLNTVRFSTVSLNGKIPPSISQISWLRSCIRYTVLQSPRAAKIWL